MKVLRSCFVMGFFKGEEKGSRKGFFQQTRVYPHPLGAGSARPNPKMGAPDPENPLFLGFSVLRGGLRPWSRKGPDHGVGVDPETVILRRGVSRTCLERHVGEYGRSGACHRKHLRLPFLGNIPSATTITSLIWWIIRCYI